MARSLEEKLEEIKHLRLDLADDPNPSEISPHRPDISVWAEKEPCDPPTVAMSIGDLWGQPVRYVDMMPSEARQLARNLIAMADLIDSMVDDQEPPDPPGFEAGFAANH